MNDDTILQEAKDRLREIKEWESPARSKMMEDVRFGNGDSSNMAQWPENVSNSRMMNDKPCLTMNRVRQYCLNIINDARENKAQIRINPVGGGASYQSAQVLEGIVRHIEYISNAQQAYDAASWWQVFSGLGFWRVTTDYANDTSSDQEIYIKRVPNAMDVYMDPHIMEYDGSDARYAFIVRDMDKKQFDKEYPKYKDIGQASTPLSSADDTSFWLSKDRIRICEYFRRIDEDDVLHHLPSGDTVKESEAKDIGMLNELRSMSAKSREIVNRKVEWYFIAGHKIIEKRDWAGRYIPLIRCVGEETVIDGKLDRKGHVRALVDAQRAYNYYSSAGIEFVALQSKAPFVAPVASIEGYEREWAQSNISNLAVLPFNHLDDDGKEIPRPERQQPPVYADAYLKGMQVAQNEMAMVSGQFEAILGEPSNERSGKAINERQRAAVKSTYHYVDHLASAIRFTGRILIDLIPKIYDTERIIKILAEDGSQQTVKIDPSMQQPYQQAPALDQESQNPDHIAAIMNPGLGEYHCVSDVGPAWATKRQEAFNALSDILAQNESLAPLIGDLWARCGDFPLSDEIAQRFKAMLPPQASGKGPSPQEQQLTQQLQAAQQALHQMANDLVQEKNQAKSKELERTIDWYKAETERFKAAGTIDPLALRPVVRQLVSEIMGMPVNQLIAQHVIHDAAAHQAADVQNPDAPPNPPPPEQGQASEASEASG